MAIKNPWFDPLKPHHTPDGFRNTEPTTHRPDAYKQWQKQRKAEGLPRPPEGGYRRFIQRWWQPADLAGSEDAIWWLGHACILVRAQGRYLLVDPALAQRASPLSFIGPARKTPSPINLDSLPSLDAIIYSHNHYDHLDKRSLKQLLRRFPQVPVIAPLGMSRSLIRMGARDIKQCDWWDSLAIAGMRLHAVPARHWSMRSLWDRNQSLWCGWVLETAAWRFYFSGDSGYSPTLTEIGQRLGPFDIAALPIGAYAPEWFMGDSHMSPASAVTLFTELGSPRVIPIHWGVFELADESLDEPPRELKRALQQAGIDNNKFSPLKIGERIIL
ncbi:MBL fold metallo-hydrolase [Biostraticola tofi]|uniref:L-ascorbate metabolism protein UlaG (Beta-lactamase superfamily) n=1 Tax=Biostraticola tofi TaxID=466109 RepID=A0A4V2W5J1_9GAMM|nr:MBL fold metallo-hydrolase [Biostraticola tofi]TCV99995.1 L-ascorbate metabolism protein UlaG (beta-lactamase superfamily) [Biostraticola tofi]